MLKEKNETKFSILISNGSYQSIKMEKLIKQKENLFLLKFVFTIMQHLGLPDWSSAETIHCSSKRKSIFFPINTQFPPPPKKKKD